MKKRWLSTALCAVMVASALTGCGGEMCIRDRIPTAQAITVKITSTGRKYPMELADEAGFYAALIPRKSMAAYTLIVTYDNGSTEEIHDPYSYAPQYTDCLLYTSSGW